MARQAIDGWQLQPDGVACSLSPVQSTAFDCYDLVLVQSLMQHVFDVFDGTANFRPGTMASKGARSESGSIKIG